MSDTIRESTYFLDLKEENGQRQEENMLNIDDIICMWWL